MFSEETVSGEVLVIPVFSKLLGLITCKVWLLRQSSQGCSARWKTDSGKSEEGVPVHGVIKCGKVYDIAR